MKLAATSLVSALLASTAAVAQVAPRLPSEAGPQVITPSGRTPAVQREAAPKAVEAGGVAALLRQAETQRRRGRKDLATDALQRALRTSPDNPQVLQRLATYAVDDGDVAQAQGWLSRLRGVTGASDRRVTELEQRLRTATAPPPPPPPPEPPPVVTAGGGTRTPGPAPAPNPTASAGPAAPAAPAVNRDPGGEARAAGFRALNGGELADAERAFNQALRARPGDLDAAGGLGVVRLQQQRFQEASELLGRAVRGEGGAARWGEALRSAQFFGGLERARAAHVAGRYAEAEAEARRLVASDHPERVEAEVLLGQALAAQDRPAEAEAAFRNALLRAPSRVEAISGLAQALSQLGRFEEALRVLDGAPKGRATDARAAVERARAADLQRRGDAFGAGASLAAALGAAPQDPWTRLEYARFLIAQGQAAQAQTVAAPLYTASDAQSLQAAALFSEARGRPDEAAALLRRIPEHSRTPAVRELAVRVQGEGVLGQARQLAQSGQTPQAVQLLREHLAQGTPGFAVRARMAELLLDLGDAYQAGALALEAARQPPARFAPQEASGFLAVLAQTGQDGPAMQLLSAAAQQAQAQPAEVNGYRSLAALYSARRADRLRLAGDYAGAFDTLSQAFALAPRDTALLSALGRLYQSGGMPQQALQAYDAVLAQAPQDAGAVLGAAQAAQAAGDLNRAERLLRRATSLRPNDPELHYQIGQMEQARGRDRAALKAFERADTLLRSGRSQALRGGAAPGGGGALGPNPFLNRTPSAALVAPGPAAPLFSAQVAAPPPLYPSIPAAGAPAADVLGSNALQAGGYLPNAVPQAWPGYPAGVNPQPAYGYPPAPAAPFQLPQPVYPAPAPAPAYGGGYAPAPAYPAAPYGAAYGGPAPVAPGGYPTPGVGYAQAAPLMLPDPTAGAPAPAPLATRVQTEITSLREAAAPQVEGSATLRARTGEQGSSRLFEASTRAAVSAAPLGLGRLGVAVNPVIISAGAPSENAALNLGTTPLIAAEATLNGDVLAPRSEENRTATGAGVALFFDSAPISFDVGTTPLGFKRPSLAGGLTGRLNLGPAQLRATIEQRPITDSVLAYSGDTDPQTGAEWGGVIRRGGGLGGSLTFGSGGAYVDAAYRQLSGRNVADNTAYELNAGAYFRPIDSDGDRLQLGVNVNMQAYDRNLRFFSYGHGGYFSPQQFVALSLPLSYQRERESWRWDAGLTLGVQAYSEDSAPVFPTSAAAQTALTTYASIDPTIRARYEAQSRTGVGVAARASGEYKIVPSTAAGAEFSIDTFGIYNEVRLKFYLRQMFVNLQ
ncbi:cellulose synthase subunit BcsC-related outer membrane protein [Phenylobacterium sp.]|uniref:cellulose synthase subunit BcsC-related outer membrane protein n=1 Tax=Phenylobacterium sp. TaxID=1871053 RepID=UPI0035B1F1DC